MPAPVVLEEVPASETWPLRALVLRDGADPSAGAFVGDDDPAALHVVARVAARVVACGSILPEAMADGPPDVRWRVRGMATLAEWRGRGVGSRVLERLLAHADARGGGVWCQARIAAVPLYQRHGFTGRGESYDLESIGPHLTMVRPGRADVGSGPDPAGVGEAGPGAAVDAGT